MVHIYGYYMVNEMLMMVNNHLVGGFSPTPLKNIRVSWGDFPFPTEWKNNPNVPNHQPVEIGKWGDHWIASRTSVRLDVNGIPIDDSQYIG